ncbi:MAG: class B sortase [Ruminococcaceae bacterium]|nr:class B sortase [Oscillospiraceae bacterium]
MKKIIRKAAVLMLTIAFCGSTALLARQGMDYWHAQQSTLQAQSAAGLEQSSVEGLPEPEVPLIPESPAQLEFRPLEENAQYLWSVDLGQLQQANEDVLGWIAIPGTQLDYPILQGEDNQYYLNHTWQGKRNAAGSVFLECKMQPDLSGFNTIIYGHNMKNGSMFGSLRQYRTQSHWQEYPCIYIVNDKGIHRYDIFAAFEAEVRGYTYRLDVNTPEKKQAFLDYSAERSAIETDLVPTVEDSVITLSTCTGNGYDHRWVVQGALTGIFTQWEDLVPEAGL